MPPVDLSTTYLGLKLGNPFMTGASPLAVHLDTVRRLEDSGCAAIVLHSLFEEQISQYQSGQIRHRDPLDPQFAAVISYFPEPDAYPLGPDEYLEHLRRVKAAVHVPVIASLNGTTPESWLKFAVLIEQAGADALELNPYDVVTDPGISAMVVEDRLRHIVSTVSDEVSLPIAVKLSPYFTALGHVVSRLQQAGASGFVLFNRFFQPDIDLEHLTVWPRLRLSDSAELLPRLRWTAILRSHVKGSLAVTGGVATPNDGIKALLAGADAVQMVSAVLRHGPSMFALMTGELRRWMESHEMASLADLRGRLSLAEIEDPNAFERAQYIRTLSGWRGWLGQETRRHPPRRDD
jgi:dihydroorotate dehydrogenase (fumarate)